MHLKSRDLLASVVIESGVQSNILPFRKHRPPDIINHLLLSRDRTISFYWIVPIIYISHGTISPLLLVASLLFQVYHWARGGTLACMLKVVAPSAEPPAIYFDRPDLLRHELPHSMLARDSGQINQFILKQAPSSCRSLAHPVLVNCTQIKIESKSNLLIFSLIVSLISDMDSRTVE